jgi:hypothetical protein
MAILQSTISRPLLLATRTLQWVSSVIAMGLYAYFVHRQRHSGTHVIYNLVISVLSVVFFIPAFLSPFKTILSKLVVTIDLIFSYLYAPLSSFYVTQLC